MSQTWGQLGLARIGAGDKWWHHRAASSKTSCANTNYSRSSSHISLDRSQSLFYFVPQEKGLIWGWKNMGESILL